MQTMVDAVKLKADLEACSIHSEPTWLTTESALGAIDRLSVEVPDTPDVLGEFDKWCRRCEAEASLEYSKMRIVPLQARLLGRVDVWAQVATKFAELQAKKE